MKRLYLSNTERKIAGVCGGLGEYFDKDPVFFRILFVLVTLLWGFGIVLYLVMWLIVPRKPKEIKTGDASKGDS